MKSFLQYLLALFLIILGIILLCHPSRPAETSQNQARQGIGTPSPQRPAFRPVMRLA